MGFSVKSIDELRSKVSSKMSERRFVHTAEVEKMAVRLGELYAPDKIPMLRVAALLHDITKEKSTDEQIAILEAHGISVSEADRRSPKTLHAKTAVFSVIDEYPEFATDEVLSAIRWHTTGRADMSLLDAIIYLADYIDMSRDFADCIFLREYFWEKDPKNMSQPDREKHLWGTVLLSLNLTLRALSVEGSPISTETLEARNAIDARFEE